MADEIPCTAEQIVEKIRQGLIDEETHKQAVFFQTLNDPDLLFHEVGLEYVGAR